MSVTELISSVQFVVDEAGNKKAVLDWQTWEELVTLLESLEVSPQPPPTLENLVARITEENLHNEVATGWPVGNEVW